MKRTLESGGGPIPSQGAGSVGCAPRHGKAARLGAHSDQESTGRLVAQCGFSRCPIHCKAADAGRVGLAPLLLYLHPAHTVSAIDCSRGEVCTADSRSLRVTASAVACFEELPTATAEAVLTAKGRLLHLRRGDCPFTMSPTGQVQRSRKGNGGCILVGKLVAALLRQAYTASE